MRDSRIINHIGERRRWENEMAKENWTEEKHAYEETSSGEERKKKDEAWEVAFRALFMGATCVERNGAASTTAVTESATVYRDTGLFSKTHLLWVNSNTGPFLLLWHTLGLNSKRKSLLFPACSFAMRHKTVKWTDRNQATNAHYIIDWLINLLKTVKNLSKFFSLQCSPIS